MIVLKMPFLLYQKPKTQVRKKKKKKKYFFLLQQKFNVFKIFIIYI